LDKEWGIQDKGREEGIEEKPTFVSQLISLLINFTLYIIALLSP